jgi:hypothetical protein
MAKDFSGSNYASYPIGFRNNNPGNLRDSGSSWQGMTGTNGGFLTFSNMDYGIRALATDLYNKIGRGLTTVSDIISAYAPSSENDTQAYIDAVTQSTGYGAYDQLGQDADTLMALVRAIIIHENGASYASLISNDDIKEGMALMQPSFLLNIGNFSATPM